MPATVERRIFVFSVNHNVCFHGPRLAFFGNPNFSSSSKELPLLHECRLLNYYVDKQIQLLSWHSLEVPCNITHRSDVSIEPQDDSDPNFRAESRCNIAKYESGLFKGCLPSYQDKSKSVIYYSIKDWGFEIGRAVKLGDLREAKRSVQIAACNSFRTVRSHQ